MRIRAPSRSGLIEVSRGAGIEKLIVADGDVGGWRAFAPVAGKMKKDSRHGHRLESRILNHPVKPSDQHPPADLISHRHSRYVKAGRNMVHVQRLETRPEPAHRILQ